MPKKNIPLLNNPANDTQTLLLDVSKRWKDSYGRHYVVFKVLWWRETGWTSYSPEVVMAFQVALRLFYRLPPILYAKQGEDTSPEEMAEILYAQIA